MKNRQDATLLSDIEMLTVVAEAVGIVLDTAEKGQPSDAGCHARIWQNSKIHFYTDSRGHPMCRPNSPPGNVEWNPLDDDGDALRALVAMGDQTRVMALAVGCGRTSCEFHNVSHGQDPGAATRRAIVIAVVNIQMDMRLKALRAR